MPSRPLSADTKAVVKLATRLDNEAIDLAKGRTELPAAVARLAQLIPPARVDLVDEVLLGVGRRDLSVALDWPPIHLVHQLAHRVKRVHLGEVRMRGANGEVVDVIHYRDKLGYDRRCYRLTRHGVFIGEYETPEVLGKVVDLAELVEDDQGEGSLTP
jgi:hypothetical protein